MKLNTSLNNKEMVQTKKEVGLVQSFSMGRHREVEQALKDFRNLGIRHIRFQISHADWQVAGAKEWYDWLFATIGKELEVLPCIMYAPTDSTTNLSTSSPQRDTNAFADFADEVISEYGAYFQSIELWSEPNKPNNSTYGNSMSDAEWGGFCEIISNAVGRCRYHGKQTVLGGLRPRDTHRLRDIFSKGLAEHIDVVGIQGFPGTFDADWVGWNSEIENLRTVLLEFDAPTNIWITAAGYATWQRDERRQVKAFINLMDANADRVYWFELKDQAAEQPVTDERTRHFGIKHADGSPKLLYTLLSEKGVDAIKEFDWMTQPLAGKKVKTQYTLITGGAGFVGTNLADRLLSQGKPVLIFDNLSRAGVQNNLFWLRSKYPDKLSIMVADIRDKAAVQQAVANASQVFHFAAQVAVTSSLTDPFHDFEVNARGTLNLLEAVRNAAHQPPVIFTSTNKVYGDLQDIGIIMNGTRYHPENMFFRQNGINEERNLDFHSPYGCTKGIADQYMLDYARTFGIKTAVFRMSCIYGPHQFGTEDQGWVAHFLIQALKKQPITLYGDGKQVRDILFIDDLVNAFLKAQENMDKISGQAFNIGGGVQNTVSLLELVELIGNIAGEKPLVHMDAWRPSDQKYYVSNFHKFSQATGWLPAVDTAAGVRMLYEWLGENAGLSNALQEKQNVIKESTPVL